MLVFGVKVVDDRIDLYLYNGDPHIFTQQLTKTIQNNWTLSEFMMLLGDVRYLTSFKQLVPYDNDFRILVVDENDKIIHID